MIKIKSVSKRFLSSQNSTCALQDINLQIKEGSFIALVGPSGSGKSTLLNLIGGLDNPTQGVIEIENRNISKYTDRELSQYRNSTIGFVFQEFHLEPLLTVKENILLPTYFNHHSKEARKYAEKLIHEVGLENKNSSKINTLSGGQKQRVAIARALVNKPKIILADEPTGNLDLKTGQLILDLLKNLHITHKNTLIIATHDEKIAQAAEEILKIADGKILR